ncbi:DUF2917 domain-containing protein [Oxalobacteraceae bacterium OM1]|nr:DUF2917 domain-containing protein [Oxalobacteraceae bacterium OM1]
MRSLFTNRALTVEPGQAVSGIAERTRTFRVVEGDVWVTVEGIDQDYWLSAGDAFVAQPGRLVVVESNGAASRIAAEPATSRWAILARELGRELLAALRPAAPASYAVKRRDALCDGC